MCGRRSLAADHRTAGGWVLGSITLSWFQVFVIAAAAVGFYVVELVLFLRASRRLAEHEAAAHARLEAMAAEVTALRERLDGVALDVEAMRQAPQSSGQYREAVEMAEQGLDAGAVADNCGISRAEADLIVALYKSRAA